jgi:hypothetical protein
MREICGLGLAGEVTPQQEVEHGEDVRVSRPTRGINPMSKGAQPGPSLAKHDLLDPITPQRHSLTLMRLTQAA